MKNELEVDLRVGRAEATINLMLDGLMKWDESKYRAALATLDKLGDEGVK